MELKGKRALVTGSSRGIGEAIARELANMGAEVIIHCVGNAKKAKTLANELSGEYTQLDLCDTKAVRDFEIKDIDILVLNASVQFRNKWESITEEEFTKQVNCNFHSSLLLMQKCVPYMREKKWGRIITVGSVQEAKPHPDMLVYSATKAAQTNMVKSLSLQLAGDGITVNNIAPGVIYTDRNVEALSDPEYAKKVMSTIPTGFYGEPSDCAGAVRLLCSDGGRYITGQSIYIDGGKSVQ